MPDYKIFSEKNSCQEPVIELLKSMGYNYASSRDVAEQKGNARKLMSSHGERTEKTSAFSFAGWRCCELSVLTKMLLYINAYVYIGRKMMKNILSER